MNPYIRGQITFGIGSVSLLATVIMFNAIPPVDANMTIWGFASSGEVNTDTWNILRTCVLIASAVGLVMAPFAAVKEQPPILPILGSGLCVFSIFFGFFLFALMVLVFFEVFIGFMVGFNSSP